MRTTITIDDETLAEVKVQAARHHRTVSSVVEEALRQFLRKGDELSGERAPARLPSFGEAHGEWKVDIADNSAVLDALGDDRAL